MAALSYPPNVIRDVMSRLDVDEELLALCDFPLPRHHASRTIALTTRALRLFEFARFGSALRTLDASAIPLANIRDVRVSNDQPTGTTAGQGCWIGPADFSLASPGAQPSATRGSPGTFSARL